ncbi:hypothetical protein [Aquisphaera insulae]|uniref:hypothetical protein n=1 Tax=Aquisphaera insulae TaxID=2712864 RepID=UPI0013E9E629|nr:hypothetical protein [Aquisphaera insulae]
MSEIDDIRRQMAQIRHDLHQDVSSVVSGVSGVVSDVTEVMDWQSSLRKHPYAVVGAAFVAGYLLVPRRRTITTALVDQVRPLASSAAVAGPAARPTKKFRPISWALGMVAPLASQAIQAYAMSWVESKLKEQIHPSPDDGRQAAPRPGQYPYPAPGRFR